MLRIVQSSKSLPASFICDPSVEFRPGMIAELTTINNQIMATVSKGIAPLGVIDEIRTRAFTHTSYDEEVIVAINGVVGPNGQKVSPVDVKVALDNPHIFRKTFTSTVDCALNEKNGIITFPAGTLLNTSLSGNGDMDAIRAFVSYTFQIPNIPGDDSTQASGRMTVWYDRMFFQTNQFETNQPYMLKSNLFVSEEGVLTTRRPTKYHPAIAMVTAPPSNFHSFLEVLWF